MRRSRWLKFVSVLLLFQLFIIASTSFSLSSLSNNKGDGFGVESNSLETNNEHAIQLEETPESVGEPRWMASYFFPIFPQFYDLDYNSVWNFLKRADTIGYFVVRDITAVSKVIISP